jgi:ATP-dependent RNA helicase DeaD
MENFLGLGLPEPLTRALAQMNFNTPTPIQAQAIPAALQGRDILGTAQTGTGKTGAFGIPLVSALIANPKAAALVMTPTRELAVQVMALLQQLLSTQRQIKGALLIGGDSMGRQLQQLRQGPRLLVGTPGRINDHLERRSPNLSVATMLVLDETDRMLDMGFSVQIDRILKHLPETRQTLLFSATLPKNILQLSEKYLNNPERVSVGSTTAPAAQIKQEIRHLREEEKYPALLEELDRREGSIILFVKTKWGTEKLAEKLSRAGHSAEAIHGDLRHSQRERVINGFRSSEYRILVATDIAARGLDIPHIAHVVNFDLPQCPEDYIHRIGRTGRAGAEGEAVCFVSPADGKKWSAIHRLLNPGAKQELRPQTSKGGANKRFGGGASKEGGGGNGNKAPFHAQKRFGAPHKGRSAAAGGGGRKFSGTAS